MRLFWIGLIITLIELNNLHCIQDKGFKIGVNLSTLSDQNMVDSEFSLNISLGGFVKFQLSNKFSLQPEVLFTTRMINFDGEVNQHFDNDNDGSVDEDQFDLLDNDGDGLVDEDRIDYFCNGNGIFNSYVIEVPILLKYLLNNSGKNNFSVFLGPSANFIVSHSIDVKSSSLSELQISDDYFDLGGVIGLEFNSNRFILDIRFSNSIIENNWEIEPKTNSLPFPDLNSSGFYPRILKSNYSSFSLLIGFLL